MQKRQLGGQGLEVSEQGLGCMGMSEFYGTRDEGEAIATIERALELGVTFLDTADMYGPFTNERLVGRAIAGRRDEVVLATKFGNERARGRQLDRDQRQARVRARRLRRVARAARRRHDRPLLPAPRRPAVPIEETVGAMAELVEAGKVRYLGLSEAAPETIRRAHAVHPISALQTEYSLWSREPEAEILPTIRELGIGFVAYSPLGRGFLTGRFRSAEDLEPEDDSPRPVPALPARRTSGTTSRSSQRDPGGRRGARRAPPASSRSRGCSRVATTSSRSRARSAAATSRRTRRRARSSSAPRTSRGSRTPSPSARPTATGMPSMDTVNR